MQLLSGLQGVFAYEQRIGTPTISTFAQQIFLGKDRIDLLIEFQPYIELASHPRVLLHDPFELLRIGEDHGGVFVEVVFKICLAVCIHESLFIIIFSLSMRNFYIL